MLRSIKANSIPDDVGYATIRLGPENTERLRVIRDLARQMEWDVGAHKKPHLLMQDLDIHSSREVRALASSSEVVDPIAAYLGSYPVFQYAAIWHSPNTKYYAGRSQDFHLDGEDLRQVKCFMPLEDIEEENGPLTVIRADTSERLFDQLVQDGTITERNTKLDDDVIERLVPKENWESLTGKLGDASFVDTSRCYHFGSRGTRPRTLLQLHYYTMAAVMVPLFIRNTRKYADEKETLLFGYHHDLFRNRRRRYWARAMSQRGQQDVAA